MIESTKTEDINELSGTKLLAFAAMVVGMFMSVLDIQIVSSSLSVIAAGLSASSDELSWIQTSYLMAEVIMIPISGFAARLFSARITYFVSVLGFTIMSILCATAWNIESMIIFRALQGFFGGAMIPTVFSVVFMIFPQKMRIKVNIIIGLVVTVAPTIGPTLGGYITEIFSWHFMFLLNVIPGIVVSIVVFKYADFGGPNYKLFKNFDFMGILLMAFSLGTTQYVLEEGDKKGWFDDNNILCLSIFALTAFVYLIIHELIHKNPIVDLSAFKNKNFTLGCCYSFILGIGLYGVVYLLPLFLATVAGYNSLQIGVTMVVTGLFQFVSAPLAGAAVSAGIDKRIVLAIGFSLFAFGTYLDSSLTSESRYWELFMPQAFRGLALMFCFVPINDIALGTIPIDEVQNASGLYNLTRNLGGAIGLATINTVITYKSSFYSQVIKEGVPLTSPTIQNKLSFFTRYLKGKVNDPELASLQLLNNIIDREAFVMAVNSVFFIISLIFLAAALLTPFFSTPKYESNPNAH